MSDDYKRKLPNILTITRMAFVPVIIAFMMVDEPIHGYIAAGLFIIASITDYYDGYFARKYKVESMLGKFLDPVSDKLLVSSILVMLVYMDRLHPIIVILLLSRDTLIGGLRSVAAAENVVIAAGNLGKWKTGVQMVMIPALLINVNLFGIPFDIIGTVGIYLSLVLSLVSGWDYLYQFFKDRKL